MTMRANPPIEQRETAYKIYSSLGRTAFFNHEHPGLIPQGLHLAMKYNAIIQDVKTGRRGRKQWILTEFGVQVAERWMKDTIRHGRKQKKTKPVKKY